MKCITPCEVYCGLLYCELICLSVRVRGCAGAVRSRVSEGLVGQFGNT